MQKMIYIVLLCVVGWCAADLTDLVVKYAALDPFRIDSFYQQPRTEDEAKKEGWIQPPETLNNSLTHVYCYGKDGRICMIYDQKGSIAGYQIAVPTAVDDLKMNFDYTKKGFNRVTLFAQDYYATTAYFVPQETIKSGGRTFDGKTGTGLWLNLAGKLTQIPLRDKDLSSDIPKFVKQNCFNKMGLHYFYDSRRDLKVEEYLPFFILYDNEGNLQGFGLVVFGSNAVKKSFWQSLPFVGSGERSWYETLPAFAVRMITPNAPDWALNYINEYGPFSHHVYMVEKPWKFSCP